MSGLRRVGAPSRPRVLAGLPALVASLADPLHTLVEQVSGLSGEIDLVARDGRGRAVAVRLAGAGEDLAALVDLVAQCDWLAPRLRDWLKLNPALGVRPDLGVRGLLLASEFDPRTLAAARALPDSEFALARVSAFEWQGSLELVLEPLARAGEPRPAPPAPHPLSELGPEVAALESRFRTGLRDDERGLPRRRGSAPRG
jgi:hypothetical protein